jgi:hypothetical protein
VSTATLEAPVRENRNGYHRERDARFVREVKAAIAAATLDAELAALPSGTACQRALNAVGNDTVAATMWLAARGIYTSRQYVGYVKAGKYKGFAARKTGNDWLPEDGERDEIAISVAALGERKVRLTLAEAREAAALMTTWDLTDEVICERLGITPACLHGWRTRSAAPEPVTRSGLEKRSSDRACGRA